MFPLSVFAATSLIEIIWSDVALDTICFSFEPNLLYSDNLLSNSKNVYYATCRSTELFLTF